VESGGGIMKILVEGSPIFRTRSGVGQYLYRLFNKLMDQDPGNTYTYYGLLFVGKHFIPPYKHKNARYHLVRFFPQKIYNILIRRFQVPPIDLLTGQKPDLVMFTNYVHPPLVYNEKSIVFVYDLSHISYEEMSDTKNAQLLRKKVPHAVNRANAVITISEYSKNDIVREYGVDPQKIHIVHPALYHHEYYPRPELQQKAVAKKFGIKGKYILFTGTIEPRKNIERLLDAYAALPQTIRDEYTLVLAGGKGWKDQGIRTKLENLQQKGEKIIVTGYVNDADLPPLYSGASLFVFPTLFEGWGMPVVEAMACGTPVVTTNNSSMPEAAGDAAIMVDAHDVKALTDEIEHVLNDKKLAESMVKKGIKHAAQFSWEQSAKDLKKVIDQVLAK
jgi:glycosyltransferase involved in cell wall biosynthesis